MDERPLRPKNWSASSIGILIGSLVSAVALVWLMFQLTPFRGVLGFVVCTVGMFALIYWLIERELHGALSATDRVASVLVASAAIVVILALATIVIFIVGRGVKALKPNFFTQTLSNAGPDAKLTTGGALHAILGTLIQTGIAVVISVPLGLLVSIFLNEIGGRFVRPVRALVDAMSGLPSIVAGLFIYAVWLVQLGNKFSGFAGGLALSILMLPSVIRTSEEVLRLVPDGLREASLALGAPQWRTVAGVVLPTARAGIITAIILGMARAVGETAPLIMTSFGSDATNLNPFSGPMASLPIFAFQKVRSSSTNYIDRGFTAALVLIVLVLILFTIARRLGARKPGKHGLIAKFRARRGMA